ncbi:MAG: hypothetical protein M1814_006231 [Vezdaea aestivalis]|nr:MAG: hypothetical protein M1814_006231 [Vezdaea aestivalis]
MLDLLNLIRAYYLLSAAAILLAASIPAFRASILPYGARSAPPATASNHPVATRSKTPTKVHLTDSNLLVEDEPYPWLRMLAGPKLPHRYFLHFYVLSVSAGVFWLLQFAIRGPILEHALEILGGPSPERPQMSIDTVLVAATLFLLHGSRRLYESLVHAKPSSSTISSAQYLLGMSFYAVTSIAIWAEGGKALKDFGRLTLLDFEPLNLSVLQLLGMLLFILASGMQFDCHAYLASLEKYTLPKHPIFNTVVCPHYMAECVIYLSFAIIAAPTGRLLNQTLVATLIFVLVNLSVTAESTKAWYAKKFGPDSVKGKPRMIPFIF